MRHQETIYLFDVDGVLTNPYSKIPNQQILKFIAEKLQNNEHVALITGRAVEWVARIILPEIKKHLSTKKSLDFLFLSGEMGSVTMSFQEGLPKEHIDPSVVLPSDILEKTKEKIKGKEPLLFIDHEKKTLLTLEMQGGSAEEVAMQAALRDEIHGWLEKEVIPQYPEYETHVSSIALDVLKKGINKKVSIEKLLSFLQERGVTGERFVTIGDSPSDVQMAEALYEQGHTVTFIYVGRRPLEKQYPFPVVTPQNGRYFDEGVVEILQQ